MAHDGGHYNENGPKPICSKALVFYDQHNHLYQKKLLVYFVIVQRMKSGLVQRQMGDLDDQHL
jgi:hypothetical protein